MALNFETEKLEKELEKRKPKKVVVQLAEGIKQNSIEINEIFKKHGVEVVFSGETAWGGCAIATHEAKEVGADLIVHFGHAKFVDVDFPVVYIEVRDELDLMPLLEKSIGSLKDYKKIGLSYSIQHKHDVEKMKKFYEKQGKEVIIPKGMGHAAYDGHVVGCEYTGLKGIENEVDCFVIIGNNFHSMGACIAVKKPIVLLDVYNNDVRDMAGQREKILRQRVISIDKLKDAKNVGVIVEVKPGQKFGSPKYLINKLREKGKNAITITMNEITVEKITNFYNIDAFVELACPRIAVDDFAKYPKPILTFKEALVALDIKTWDDIMKMGVL